MRIRLVATVKSIGKANLEGQEENHMLPSQKSGITSTKNCRTLTLMGAASAVVALTLGVCGQTVAQQVPWTKPVPRANCATTDRVETSCCGRRSPDRTGTEQFLVARGKLPNSFVLRSR